MNTIGKGNRCCWLCTHYDKEKHFCNKFNGKVQSFDWCLTFEKKV